MMEKLYGIYGHELIRSRLYKSVKENKLFNSYVFEGKEGSGRKTTADLFAAAVVCKNKEGRLPCGECDACRKVLSHNHPDVLYVEKEKGKKTIGVDVLRESVINNVYIKPLIAEKKIIIFPNGEALTEQSQNALLKVLEEPPEYAVFIIITESAGMLLKTVLSRSVVFSFMPVGQEIVLKVLNEKLGKSFSKEEISFASKFADGIPGKALQILQNEEFSGLYKKTIAQILDFVKKKHAVCELEAFLTEEKENIDAVINFMLIFFRDCVLFMLKKEKLIICEDYLHDISVFLKSVSLKQLIAAEELVLAYKESLSRNAGFQTATADVLLRLKDALA